MLRQLIGCPDVPFALSTTGGASSDGSVWSAHSDQSAHVAALGDMSRVTLPTKTPPNVEVGDAINALGA
jgi:hypothetical protein